jgi:hypothetical protein
MAPSGDRAAGVKARPKADPPQQRLIQWLRAPRTPPAAGHSRFCLGPTLGKPKQPPIRELEITAENLHFAFAAAFAFDHELRSDWKPAGQPT